VKKWKRLDGKWKPFISVGQSEWDLPFDMASIVPDHWMVCPMNSLAKEGLWVEQIIK
jgi:hypothetical protein